MTVNDLQQLEVGPFLILYCNIFSLQLKIMQPNALGFLKISQYNQYQKVLETQRREIRMSMMKLPVKPSSKPAFYSHPQQHNNNEITPSSRSGDYRKQVCAHFLLFDKMYNFMNSTCISCVILTMALCYLPFP